MRKVFFAIIIVLMLTSCVSTPKKYSDKSYSLTAEFSWEKEELKKIATKKTKALGYKYFSYTWDGNTLSFSPAENLEKLVYFDNEIFSTHYVDIETNKENLVPVYKQEPHWISCSTMIQNSIRPEVDLNRIYNDDDSEYIDNKTFKYWFYIDNENKNLHKRYPLQKVKIYFCNNEVAISELCDFEFKTYKEGFEYKDTNFKDKKLWTVTTSNGYLSKAGLGSIDGKIYHQFIMGTPRPTNYLVVELDFNNYIREYRIYYFDKYNSDHVYICDTAIAPTYVFNLK